MNRDLKHNLYPSYSGLQPEWAKELIRWVYTDPNSSKRSIALGQTGQTLVEIVVAIGVVVMLVVGLVVATTSSLGAIQYGRTKSLAVRYTQEGVEIARNLRNNSWETFISYGDTAPQPWCLSQNGTFSQYAGTCSLIDGMFTRVVTFTWSDPRMKVEVSVSWTDAAGTHTNQATTLFTQWR